MESLAFAELLGGSGSRTSRSVGSPPLAPAAGCPSPGVDGAPPASEPGGLEAGEPEDVDGEPLDELGEPWLCDGDPDGGGLLEGEPDDELGGGGGALLGIEGGALLGIDGGGLLLLEDMDAQAPSIMLTVVMSRILRIPVFCGIAASIHRVWTKNQVMQA